MRYMLIYNDNYVDIILIFYTIIKKKIKPSINILLPN